jgi:four helix bundle protein
MGSVTSRFDAGTISRAEKASRARSNEEFVSKLGGALQEADETQMWLELLREECGIAPADTLPMEKEADELLAIMTTMINKTKGKS